MRFIAAGLKHDSFLSHILPVQWRLSEYLYIIVATSRLFLNKHIKIESFKKNVYMFIMNN